MTTSRFSKSLVTAAIGAALLTPAAMADSGITYAADNLRVDTQAVNMVSQSWADVADAYDRLQAGDTAKARAELAEAIAKLRTASMKDATLGVSFNGQTKPVKALHDELAGLQTRLTDPSAKTQLQTMLQSAGVI